MSPGDKTKLEQTVPLEIHLGDDVYASVQFGSVMLRTPCSDGGDYCIAMDARVLEAFREFLEDMGL